MYRVDTSTACAAMPAPSAPGTPGWFQNANPAMGIPATMPGADWFNTVQAELENVVLGAGLTPNKANRGQVWNAIQIAAAAGAAIIGENLWSRPVKKIVTALPGSPSNGDRYLIAESGTSGTAVGHESNVAEYKSDTWIFSGNPQDQQEVVITDGGASRVANSANIPSRIFHYSAAMSVWLPKPVSINGNVAPHCLPRLNKHIQRYAFQEARIDANLFGDSINSLVNTQGRTIPQVIAYYLAKYAAAMNFYVNVNDRHVNGTVTAQLLPSGDASFPNGMWAQAVLGAAPGTGYFVPSPPWPGNDTPIVTFESMGTNDAAVDMINLSGPPGTYYKNLKAFAQKVLSYGSDLVLICHHPRTGGTAPAVDGNATWPPGHTGTTAAYPSVDPTYDPLLYGFPFQVDIRQVLLNRVKRRVGYELGLHVIDVERKFIEYVYRYGMNAVQGTNTPHPWPLGMDAYEECIREFFLGLMTSTQSSSAPQVIGQRDFFQSTDNGLNPATSPSYIFVPKGTSGTLWITLGTPDGLQFTHEVIWNWLSDTLVIRDRDSAGGVGAGTDHITSIVVGVDGLGAPAIIVNYNLSGVLMWKFDVRW